jgi:hypothetical protein
MGQKTYNDVDEASVSILHDKPSLTQ